MIYAMLQCPVRGHLQYASKGIWIDACSLRDFACISLFIQCIILNKKCFKINYVNCGFTPLTF